MSFQPFAVWQSLGSSLAPDGDLEVLTPGALSGFAKVVLVAGIVFIVLQRGMAVKPAASQELLQRMGRSIRSLRSASQLIGAPSSASCGWPPERVDRWIVWGLMLLSVLARVTLLDRPMLHDESYTVEAWAAGSVRNLLEDYHLPNNHIFHTLLVSFFIKTFGVLPWIVRLPAFSAIALLIPACMVWRAAGTDVGRVS